MQPVRSAVEVTQVPQSLIVFLRNSFSFFSLLVVARIVSKRQISQLTFLNYVTGITIGSFSVLG